MDRGEIGDRLDVFEKAPPHALYPSAGSDWRAEATTDCTIGVCTAPGGTSRPAQRLGPDGIVQATRGTGANTRHIYNVAMEDRDVADSLLVTEVFTPQGNWSSYTPHRHDEDDFPLVPKGHHPCGAPYGYEMYYLNVMAGPLRKWRFRNHPDHDWIARRDAS